MYLTSLNPDDPKGAASLTSYLMLFSNLIVIPLAFGVGYIGDKFKVWKLMIIFTTCSCFFQTLMIVDEGNKIMLYVGFVGAMAFIITVLLLVNSTALNLYRA